MLKKTDKWTELEETSLRLLFSVLKEFPDYSSSCSSSYRYNNSSDLSSVPSDMNSTGTVDSDSGSGSDSD
jgi:hypothetical protein